MMPHLVPPVPARARRLLLPPLIAFALSQAACGTGAQSLPGTAPATGAATPSPTGEKALIDVTPVDGVALPSGGVSTDADVVTPTVTASPSAGSDTDVAMPTGTASPSSGGSTDAGGEPSTDTATPSGGGSTGDGAEPSTDAPSTGGDEGGDTASPEDVAASPPEGNAAPDATDDASIGCGATRARALELINAARAEARFCGDVRFEAVDPLVWDSRLEDAAGDHSTDMTTHNFFAHEGSDGGSVGGRAEASGYDWQSVGENIAAGQRTIDQAMSGWVDSPGHCANLMKARFEDVAVACVRDGGADYEYYWTQVFGRAFR